MKYVLLIYQPSAFNPKGLSKDEHATIAAEYQALTSLPNVTPGPPLGLPEKATTVRSRQDKPVAGQGPYVDAAGAIGGFMIVEVNNHDEAVAIAARIPAVQLGGGVEIRPCEVYW